MEDEDNMQSREKAPRLIRRCILVIAGLTLSALPTVAQVRSNGFFLTSPLEISSGYDSRFITSTGQLSGPVSTVTGPVMSWINSTHRTHFSIDYKPEAQFLPGNPDLNSWNQSSILRLTNRLNSRWSLDLGNSFLDTSDPNRALVNSLILLPRSRYRENVVYGEATYRVDHSTRVKVRFDNSVNTVALTGAQKGRLDRIANAATVTLDRSLTAAQNISGSYSFLRVTPLHSSVSGGPTNVHLVNAVYTYDVTRSLLLRLAGGWVAGAQTAATGAIGAEKAFGRLWTAVGYQRYVGFFGGLVPVSGLPVATSFASGITPDSLYQVVSVKVWGQLSRRVGMDITGQRATNGIAGQSVDVRSLIGRFRLTWRLTDTFSVFAEADHYGQSINQFSGRPLSENRYLAGIRVALARPPEPDTIRPGRRKGAPEAQDVPNEVVNGETPKVQEN